MSNYVIERSASLDVCTVAQDSITDIWSGELGFVMAGNKEHLYGHFYKQESAGRLWRINLPADSVLQHVYLKLTAHDGLIDSQVNTRIYFEKSYNAQHFLRSFDPVAIYDDYIARSRTGYVEWTITEWITGTVYQSPDLIVPFQELFDLYGKLDRANIVVFWGDLGGNTPRPDYPNANYVWASTYGDNRLVLRVEFASDETLPSPYEVNTFEAPDTLIQDFNYTLTDKIVNDARVMSPSQRMLDMTQNPPVWINSDYVNRKVDTDSVYKYGRRTKNFKYPIGNFPYYGESYLDYELRNSEPTPEGQVKLIGKNDSSIEQILKTRISDIYSVSVDSMELNEDYFIDDIHLEIGPVMIMNAGLTQMRHKFKHFILGQSLLGGTDVI